MNPDQTAHWEQSDLDSYFWNTDYLWKSAGEGAEGKDGDWWEKG